MSVLNTHNGYEFPNLSTNGRELQGTFENHLPIVMRKLARRLSPVAADGQRAMVVIITSTRFRRLRTTERTLHFQQYFIVCAQRKQSLNAGEGFM